MKIFLLSSTLLCAAILNSSSVSAQICPYPTITAELTTLIWAEEITWSILNEDGTTAAGPFTNFTNNSTFVEQLCLPPGCYSAFLEDSFGDGWHNGGITFTTVTGELLASGTVGEFTNLIDLFTSPDCYATPCPPGETSIYSVLTGDPYGVELSWGINNELGMAVAGPFTGFANYTQYTNNFCLSPECYTVWMNDSYGDGWQGAELSFYDEFGVLISSGLVPNPPGDSATMPLPLTDFCPIPGCTNVNAFNYNPLATQNDGSCTRQSDNVELYGFWTDATLPITGFGGSFNDVEGLLVNGKEYAILGSTVGTHILDVSAPGEAIEVAFLPGATGGSFVTHRDYHINGSILYAVCDQGSSSLQIFDLNTLPNSVTTLYDSNEFCITAHNVFVDNASNLLYLCSTASPGANTPIRVLDVSDPTAPVPYLDLAPWIGYCHDIYVENDTAWINSGGAGLFVMHISPTPSFIATLTDYPFQGTNHSGWWDSQAQTYVFADETHGSPLKVVDTSVMTDLQVVSTLSSGVDLQSIPHNLMMRDGFVYVSYYHDGLQVFDVRDPYNSKLVAWYDTHIESSHAGYAGAWGVHSALPSGRILISDISGGLFVLDIIIEELEVCPTTPTIWNGISIASEDYFSTEVPDLEWGTDIRLSHSTFNSAICPLCPGDFDLNGNYGVGDLQILLATIGCTSGCIIDLNGDDSTTVGDLLVWLGYFGNNC
ncbi:MAG: hypothetical protein COA49_08615 [Bacteroidetes bacterium]|nr:MAG: hypothetical protein COA49_08615 [Bacteroidota bacterium]